jgi:predicted RNA-binding Zn-ribbon protein involved in translation (DUF1610 family)
MTHFRYDTFCGLYCGACDVLQANSAGTYEALARAWGMESDGLRCHGCKSEVNAVYCLDCDIKACAESKGIEFCFECVDYPCQRLVSFRNDQHAHHSIVLQNLGEIRKLGTEAWLAGQRVRWSCPECGNPFTWYDERCKTCGTELYNCEHEEGHIADDDLHGVTY